MSRFGICNSCGGSLTTVNSRCSVCSPTTGPKCPVCSKGLCNEVLRQDDKAKIKCRWCGEFWISGSCESVLAGRLLDDRRQIASVGWWLRDQSKHREPVLLLSETVGRLARQPELPDLHTQIENLVRLIGDQAEIPGRKQRIFQADIFRIGCVAFDALTEIAHHLAREGIVSIHSESPRLTVSATVSGWLRYEELKRGASVGRQAFMAMPFGDHELNEIWYPRLQEAVQETGFQLRRLDEVPRSGLIDLHMLEQIECARFLIVELTHDNLCADWEAGYAEGMRKPVIYPCHTDTQPHFDVEHRFTVEWHPDDLEPALSRMKTVIRYTIPESLPDPDLVD